MLSFGEVYVDTDALRVCYGSSDDTRVENLCAELE